MHARISTQVLQKSTKCSSPLSHPSTPVFLLRVTLLLCFHATSLYFTTIAQTSLLLWRPGKQMIKYSPRMCAPVRQSQCKQLQPLQPTHKKIYATSTREQPETLVNIFVSQHLKPTGASFTWFSYRFLPGHQWTMFETKPSLLSLSTSVCFSLSDP